MEERVCGTGWSDASRRARQSVLVRFWTWSSSQTTKQARTSFLSPWCARGEVPPGVNLNRYAGLGSHIPWHRDNGTLFGPQNSP